MKNFSLNGKLVLVTAGPTREPIDPVRYISNHSSGKMGYAIARVLLQQGAIVHLVSGPVAIQPPVHPQLALQKVTTAAEMYKACENLFSEVDIAVFAAAVADYRPAHASTQKIKKSSEGLTIKMIRNVDIAAAFGQVKRTSQLSVGFALETNDERKNAMAKLKKKNFDLVVLNSMNDAQAGFGYDTNKISIIDRHLHCREFNLQTKERVAEDIVAAIRAALCLQQDYAVERSDYVYENLYR